MKDIAGVEKAVEMLLSGPAFGIDYYQREYRWEKKQVQELVDDLLNQFLQTWNPETPPEKQSKYFLGSIVVSNVKGVRNIVDGQQRLTTLTLLLIYLNRLQSDLSSPVEKIRTLVYSEEPGGRKFKLDIPERNDCMKALLEGESYNPEGKSDSVRNLLERYEELEGFFDLSDDQLEGFIWWLIRNVKLIEITAQDDGDAYTIFETMNDRGLSLTPTDMLKGYLLANINEKKRDEANKFIKKYLAKFNEYAEKKTEEKDADFFKAWLRSQYAKKIRERKENALPEDFDKIGTEYHRWVRQNKKTLKLTKDEDFYKFVVRDMQFFAEIYLILLEAAKTRTKGLESVKYNADAGFTLQHHVILAAVTPEDDKSTALAKAKVVADFLDCWITLRAWNGKSNRYSTTQYAAFTFIRSIRGKSLSEIKTTLHKRLLAERKELEFHDEFSLTKSNGKTVQRIIARFIDWMDQASGETGRYENYIVRSRKNAFEIEHILADKFDTYKEEFDDQSEFEKWRNYIGALLLLPKKKNASSGADNYAKKRKMYLKENKLAQSLHPDFYNNNPGFLNAIDEYNLDFKPHDEFLIDDINERTDLYCALAEIIWSPERILSE